MYINIKFKIATMMILISINVILSSDCGTPLGCYNKAIDMLNKDRELLNQQTENIKKA
jgi:hypothetical protein